MKKFICAVLSFLIVFGSLCNIVYAVSQESISECLTAEDFAEEIGGLLMSVDESDNLPGEKKSDCSDDCLDFETARLIVKSDSKINTLNASSVINGYDDIWILQFDNSHEAADAYDYYSSRAGIDYVEPDRIIQSTDPVIIEHNPIIIDNTNDYLSWGPEHIGIDKFNKDILEKLPLFQTRLLQLLTQALTPITLSLRAELYPPKSTQVHRA